MEYIPPELKSAVKRRLGLEWSDLTGDEQRKLLTNYQQAGGVGDWDQFFNKAGLINLEEENRVLDAIRKEENAQIIAERDQAIANSDRWTEMVNAWHQNQYKRRMDALNSIQRSYSYHVMKRDYGDTKSLAYFSPGMKEVYKTPVLLPLNALNRTYPIRKRVSQESSWDRFANSVEKGWHYFARWFVEEGWKLLLSLSVEIILGCIPGVGALLGMVARTGADIMIDVLDHAKSSAERAHLQRAIEEGKSRGLDAYEEMFMWRSVMVSLILAVSQANGFILQSGDLASVFRTKDEFMERIQNQDFLQSLWAVEGQAGKDLVGEDQDGEPDFQKVPEDLVASREMALELLRECLETGTVRGMSQNDLKCWLG